MIKLSLMTLSRWDITNFLRGDGEVGIFKSKMDRMKRMNVDF